MQYLIDLLFGHLFKKVKSAMNNFCENYNKKKQENKRPKIGRNYQQEEKIRSAFKIPEKNTKENNPNR